MTVCILCQIFIKNKIVHRLIIGTGGIVKIFTLIHKYHLCMIKGTCSYCGAILDDDGWCPNGHQ